MVEIMSERFVRQLEELHVELITMGSLCEKAISLSAKAIQGEGGMTLIGKIFETEKEIDAQEREIENPCMKLLLHEHPVAGDLRSISAALKMISDMERIGDQAADISELALCLVNEKELPMMDRMKQMSQECMLMVMKALEAFVAKDIEMAKKVIARDDVIDAMFDDTKKEVIELIQNHGAGAEVATDLLMVAKYFERIGDHATNIAEWVIFSINGTHPTINPEPVL